LAGVGADVGANGFKQSLAGDWLLQWEITGWSGQPGKNVIES